MIWWLLALTIVQFIIILFLWWQFSFTDSKLCKLIDNRSKQIEHIDILDEEGKIMNNK